MKYIPIILTIGTIILLIRVFRVQILRWLIRLRAKLKVKSLREAIEDADKDKKKTGRKNMVVFNAASGRYEPLQKRILKAGAKSGRNKNNAKMTDGRKRMMKKKKRVVDPAIIKSIEEKSLYVTN